ncbi:MAG: efflux RND transporter periplasmic adaptor subunit [Pseudomonadota bacterium]|nr:efflux RND transporter periplasmic adaptor subunit [Pseudomonadota bacterium]
MQRSCVIAIALALLAVLWIGSGFLKPEHSEASIVTAPQNADDALPKVRVRDIQAEPMASQIIVTGRTKASRHVSLKAKIAGPVAKVHVAEGALVTTGDPLIEIALENRSARLKQARAERDSYLIEYSASRSLAEKGFKSEVRLAEVKARLELGRANVHQAEMALADTVIRAPWDGIMEVRHVEIGDMLAPGTPVADLVDLDPIKAVGFVAEQSIGDIKIGGPGRIRLLSGRTMNGTIDFIASIADPATRTFRVELTVDNPDRCAAEGMTAEMILPTQSRKAQRISSSALILSDTGEIGVKILDADNIVHFVSVEIIGEDADGIWLSGLPDHVRLVTVGHGYVSQGRKVAHFIVTP